MLSRNEYQKAMLACTDKSDANGPFVLHSTAIS